MKKLSWLIALLMGCNVVDGASNQTYLKNGSYFDANTTATSVLSITSSTYKTTSAVNGGVKRIIQNTGSSNAQFFFVVSDSTTVSPKNYLIGGEKWMETDYFGDIYWIAPAGITGSTVTVTTFTNK